MFTARLAGAVACANSACGKVALASVVASTAVRIDRFKETPGTVTPSYSRSDGTTALCRFNCSFIRMPPGHPYRGDRTVHHHSRCRAGLTVAGPSGLSSHRQGYRILSRHKSRPAEPAKHTLRGNIRPFATSDAAANHRTRRAIKMSASGSKMNNPGLCRSRSLSIHTIGRTCQRAERKSKLADIACRTFLKQQTGWVDGYNRQVT
jgi:hypothetical protein